MDTQVLSRTCCRNLNHTCHGAFTMPELVIVIGLTAITASMLFPGLNAARERVRRVVCANNLKQWGVALAAYRQDTFDYLPTEGSYWDLHDRGTWFNALPPYLDIPAYIDIERLDDETIKEFPALSTWICPAKDRTNSYKSYSGKNQFHYGMNQVLDGLGSESRPSADTPGFLDIKKHLGAHLFRNHVNTVFMIEIAGNSMAGTPRNVATEYQRNFRGASMGKFHGDYANILYLNGTVGNVTTDDLVTNRDFKNGSVLWNHPRLYWGYTPSR